MNIRQSMQFTTRLAVVFMLCAACQAENSNVQRSMTKITRLVPYSEKSVRIGRSPFLMSCTRCHGHDGKALIADGKTRRLTLTNLLPGVGRQNVVESGPRKYVKLLVGPEKEKHRRLAKNPKRVRIFNRDDLISLSLLAEDNKCADISSKLFGTVHQIYTLFLREGGYDECVSSVFGVNLDTYM